MNILIVDDELLLLKSMEGIVKELCPEDNVACFSKAKEALKYAEENPVDIAFLDINMRVMSGLMMAKILQEKYSKVNIIFCTGYEEYMKDAFGMYASGYLLKPVTQEKVSEALEHLRYPIMVQETKDVSFHCFGHFEAYFQGEAIHFKYSRTKELLAYLVDRDGACCSTKELQAILFEDENHLSYFNQLRKDLISTFEELGASDVIYQSKGLLGVNRNMVACDYFDYLDGKNSITPTQYMLQYSFGEYTLPKILK